MKAEDYFDSIQISLKDLRAADVSTDVWRELDRYVGAVRDMFVEYRVPVRGKTLCEVFAAEQKRAES